MNEFKKSQVVLLFVLALLLLISRFLPSSMRPTFMYFIFNFLIIALGAEAGLLSAFSRPLEEKNYYAFSRPMEEKKQSPSVTQISVMPQEAIPEERNTSSTNNESTASDSEHNEKNLMVVKKIKKCPSMPNLFIGGEKTEAEATDEELEAEEETGGIDGQELSAKAEAFIANFYKQLKMQRTCTIS